MPGWPFERESVVPHPLCRDGGALLKEVHFFISHELAVFMLWPSIEFQLLIAKNSVLMYRGKHVILKFTEHKDAAAATFKWAPKAALSFGQG